MSGELCPGFVGRIVQLSDLEKSRQRKTFYISIKLTFCIVAKSEKLRNLAPPK